MSNKTALVATRINYPREREFQLTGGSFRVAALERSQLSELNNNSFLYWWPLVKDLGIPVPKSTVCKIDLADVRCAAECIGFPLFMRTDLCSGKHNWINSCFVSNASHIEENMITVIQDNVRWSMLGIHPQAMVLREFLALETAFVAFDGDMPINREFRYFIEDGNIQCMHPYWPETAFNRHPARMAHHPNWKERLRLLSQPDASQDIITEYVSRMTHLKGSWSADFAKGKNGTWYLIDMALAHNSYHMTHEEGY